MTTRCEACGRIEGEPLNDECWPCQRDGEPSEPVLSGRVEAQNQLSALAHLELWQSAAAQASRAAL
jgi:hypothetical protein